MAQVRASVCTLAAMIVAAAIVGACASPYRVVQLPEREADLYPLSQSKEGVTIAVDEIKGAARAERYFGADLLKANVLPVAVIVSNYGQGSVLVKPSDILLHRAKEIVDPLRLETVVATAKRQHWFLRAQTETEIQNFFEGLAFRETALAPNETYQGVLFFSIPQPARRRDELFMISNLFREGGPKIRIGVTDLDSRKRLHFGPFTISAGQERFSY